MSNTKPEEQDFAKIKQIVAAIVKKDLLTNEDLSGFILEIIAEFVRMRKLFSKLQDEQEKTLNEALVDFKDSFREALQILETKNDKDKAPIINKLNEKLVSFEKLYNELKAIKATPGQPGKDADKEEIVQEVLSMIKLPDNKEVILDDGEEIVDKINELPIDDEHKIDASHIKNLPIGEAHGVGGSRLLYQLLDVSITAPTTGQTLVYNAVTNLWENSTPSGSGDVVGPASATSNAIAIYNGTTGKLIRNSTAIVNPISGAITAGAYNGNTIGSGSTSGSNTGDQTITLTGDVTGTGTGSFTTTIANDSVTQAKVAEYTANTLWANNTGSAANPSDITFVSVGETAYTGTPTFTGTTAPSGANNYTYRWLQVDGVVTLFCTFVWATQGTAITQAVFPLIGTGGGTAGMPNPASPAGLGGVSGYLFQGNGGMANSLTGDNNNNGKSKIRLNAAGNGYDLVVDSASSNVRAIRVQIQYYV